MTNLSAAAVTKHFGGLTALDSVSLDFKPGEVHGLIGPNGSGKTTLLNLLCGFYGADSGEVRIGDKDISGTTVQQRARLGLGGTFQTPRILGALSVLDNAMLGCWQQMRAGFVETALGLPGVRRDERAMRCLAEELLRGVGLGPAADQQANLLEHTAQRFLEIARALAMQPRFLLLDEPAGGLTETEIAHHGDIIRVVRESGIGVLLVEHHTDFVFHICDQVTTLDRGRLIKHGTPAAVRSDPEVIRVYLGA